MRAQLSGRMLPAWEFFTLRATEDETHIAQATLGNEAGLYGAAYLPWIEQ